MPLGPALPCAAARRFFTFLTAIAVALVIGLPCRAFAQGRWTTETRLPKPLAEISVVGLGGKVFVAGGSIHKITTNEAWSHDPATRKWTALAPYPGEARDHAGIATVGGFIYLIDGTTRWPQPSVTAVHKYDPVANTWTPVAPLPNARGAMGIAVLNGKIYAAGGVTAAVSVADFTVYDPGTDTWTPLAPMPTARDHRTAAAVNGKIYAIGGRINPQACSPMNVVEVYDPGRIRGRPASR
jgi:N-acetylneuraminic acid mutarotase